MRKLPCKRLILLRKVQCAEVRKLAPPTGEAATSAAVAAALIRAVEEGDEVILARNGSDGLALSRFSQQIAPASSYLATQFSQPIALAVALSPTHYAPTRESVLNNADVQAANATKVPVWAKQATGSLNLWSTPYDYTPVFDDVMAKMVSGSLDAAGTIMFHGRLKDMLKVGGENVAAAEIEAALQRHPAVKLAQVVGIPDRKYDEVPAAFVEFEPGRSASEQELIEFCRQQIAAFKVPRLVRFVNEWPMSTSKIQKFKLRQDLLRELGLGN